MSKAIARWKFHLLRLGSDPRVHKIYQGRVCFLSFSSVPYGAIISRSLFVFFFVLFSFLPSGCRNVFQLFRLMRQWKKEITQLAKRCPWSVLWFHWETKYWATLNGPLFQFSCNWNSKIVKDVSRLSLCFSSTLIIFIIFVGWESLTMMITVGAFEYLTHIQCRWSSIQQHVSCELSWLFLESDTHARANSR